MHLFDILPAISSGKVGDFFCLESGNPVAYSTASSEPRWVWISCLFFDFGGQCKMKGY